MILYDIILHDIISYYMISYDIIFYYIIYCFISLHYIIFEGFRESPVRSAVAQAQDAWLQGASEATSSRLQQGLLGLKRGEIGLL